MKRIVYHVIRPSIMPVVFFAVASTPVEVSECARRCVIAFLIAFISGLEALVVAIIELKGRVREKRDSIWWVTSTVILAIPVIAMTVLA